MDINQRKQILKLANEAGALRIKTHKKLSAFLGQEQELDYSRPAEAAINLISCAESLLLNIAEH